MLPLRIILCDAHAFRKIRIYSMSTLEKRQREFLEYLEIEKGRSLKTVENYGRYLAHFFSFAGVGAPEDITEDLVRRYRLFLNRQSVKRPDGNTTLKKKTQNYYLIALRSFLKYLLKRGLDSCHF